jgi:hypothetical protein
LRFLTKPFQDRAARGIGERRKSLFVSHDLR